MKYLNLLFLAAFAWWGVSVAAIDMATRKIPNSKVVFGFRLLLLALGLLAVNSWLGYQGQAASFLNWNFYPLWGVHFLWSVLAGLVLWYSGIWPAGDAKFFMLCAAWLPVINPFLRNFPNYLFIGLLVNTFVAAALVAFGSFIASGFYQASPADFFSELWRDVKARFASLAGEGSKGGWLIAGYLANLTFLFLLQQVLNMETRYFLGKVIGRTDILYFFLFFLWDKVGGTFGSKKWTYFSTACYAAYFFGGYFFFHDRLVALLLAAFANVFKFSLLLFFGRFMLEHLMEKKDTVYVGPRELEPGMILSAKAARTLKDNPVFDGEFDDNFKDGLTPEQVELLRGWLAKLPVQDPKIETVKGRPFALWIFAGAALTLLLDRGLMSFFK
ncbi:MAG: prepilin peptidase [Elusimicrobia bacterium]|nr:prepilin peptidase [Elusimicrobiota bacterium]